MMLIDVKHIAKTMAKLLVLMMGFYLTGAIAQALQIAMSIEASRAAIIENWKANKPEQADLVDTFTQKCLQPIARSTVGPVEQNQLLLKPIVKTFAECGADIGATEIGHQLDAVDAFFEKNVAWPLSTWM